MEVSVYVEPEDTAQPSNGDSVTVDLVQPTKDSAGPSKPKKGKQTRAANDGEEGGMPTKGVSLRRVLEELGPEFLKTTKRCIDHYDRELISFKTPRDGYECFCCHRKQFPIHSSMYRCGCDSCEKALCAECFRAELTTKNAVAGVIKPMTSQDQVSVVELWENEQAKDGKKRVQETADFFFSHAWRYRIIDVLDVLRSVLQDQIAKKVAQGENEEDVDVFIWMDIFVINQHTNQQLSQEFVASGFHNAIATIGKVVIMITPWHAPHSMTRAWCIWELYGGIIKEVQTDLYMVPGEHEKFIETLINDYHSIMKHLCKIDAAKAQAYMPEDLDMIMTEIKKPGGPGIEGVNEVVMSFLRDWVASSGSKELQDMEEREGFDESNSRMYALLCHHVGAFQIEQGNLKEAERLLRKALEIYRKLEGDEGENVAMSLNSLATVLERKGQYDGAEALDREALAIRKKALGDEHPSVASSLHNLAEVLWYQGKYDDAEALHREALGVKKLYGDESPSVAVSLSNLAMVLERQGKLDEAETMNREALAVHRKVQGDDHPDVATSLSNLAAVLYGQDKYDEAETMLREALATTKKVHGDEHPSVATILHNLASVLAERGKYDEAESMNREALAATRKIHGNAHPEVAFALISLATRLEEQGMYDEAESMYREALAIRKQIHGDGHPDVADSLNHLSYVLYCQGKYDESEAAARGSFFILMIQLGDEHPRTAHARTNLRNIQTQIANQDL